MTTVSVVYSSGKEHTGAVAEAMARGAQSVAGVQVQLTVERYGRRVASLAHRWKGDGEYTTEYITTSV